MDSKELRGLYEAYSEVYAPQQIDELSVNKMHDYINKAEKDRDRLNKKWDQGTATPKERKKVFDREEGEARASKKIRQKTGKDPFKLNALDKLKSAVKKEELDIFDVVLEFLQAEGFAETLEEAEWMMANVIDEEAIEIVVGEGYQRNPEKGEKEDKKYAPVRGEKTPMPPRGDKRREDFEKWYAKQMGR